MDRNNNNGWGGGTCKNNEKIDFWINENWYGRFWGGDGTPFSCWDAAKGDLIANVKKDNNGGATGVGWNMAYACHVGVVSH